MATVFTKHNYKDAGFPTNFSIPEGVAEIGDGVFEGCTSLQSISIPEGVTKINSWAFVGSSTIQNISWSVSIK